MSETSAVTAAQPAESVIERALRAQPIWLRETRQASRLLRTPWILFALTVIVTLGLSAFGAVAVSDHVTPSNIGTMVFHVFFSIAYVVVVLAGSAIAANAIAVEREGKTFEALQLTGLGPRQVARQKFASAYTQLAQYIFALAPVGALSFLFGGVTTTEVVIAYVMLFAVGALSVGFGLALSSLMPNLRAALLSTVAVSVIAGPALWGFFGFGGSAVAHHLWHDIPEAHPIWMPLAYTRAPLSPLSTSTASSRTTPPRSFTRATRAVIPSRTRFAMARMDHIVEACLRPGTRPGVGPRPQEAVEG